MSRPLKALLIVLTLLSAVAVVLLIPTRQYDARVSHYFSTLGIEARDQAGIPFQLQNLEGQPVSLDDYRGQWVLVNFWATWCEPCRAEMPSMREFARRFPTQKLRLVAISIDQDSTPIRSFLIEQGITPDDFVIAHDGTGEISGAYGSRLIPETWIIDPQGHMIGRMQGALDWTQPDVLSLFEILLRDGWRPKRT